MAKASHDTVELTRCYLLLPLSRIPALPIRNSGRTFERRSLPAKKSNMGLWITQRFRCLAILPS